MGKVKKAGAARTKRTKRKKPVARAKKGTKPVPPVFTVRPLDPAAKCGPGTSVQLLYRVDERSEREVRTHLVFFDKHGWYCEHGRTCPAVAHAQRESRR